MEEKVLSREEILANLNDRQREATVATAGPVLILAGAGSGKTRVLVHRIAYMINVENVSPGNILAITFTNKAADEMRNRVNDMIGFRAGEIWVMTFHAFCVRVLRRHAEELGFNRYFSIYDTDDQLRLVKDIFRRKDINPKTLSEKSVLREISKQKNENITAETFAAKNQWSEYYRRVAEVYKDYQERLIEANAMDFDDLLMHTVALFAKYPEILELYQERFRYLMVDEYQDTNNVQFRLVKLLSAKYRNLCVVGDDDQSIYKFRGATIENILSFESQYPHCRTIRLEQNYRSTGHILDAANGVIRHNFARKGKELWTNAGAGDLIELYCADNEHEEAQYVASRILADFSAGGNFRDHAVLYRMNAQSSQLEFAFKRNGIPYRIFGGTRFFDHTEVKDMLAYLNVICTPADDLRLSRIINSPPRGIGERSIELVRRLASENGCSMFEILRQADRHPELARPAVKLRQFAQMIEQLRAFAEHNPPDAVYDELLDKTGYLLALERSDDDKDETRAENVRELKSSMLSFMKDSGDLTLEGYLANVALYTDLDNYDRESDSVVMMTMHSAKGLEFPTVFIVGCEEGIFPGIRAIGEPEEMEEERRLCYVAVTRAKRRLYLTCARQRMLFGRTTANRVSRFVDEIPEEHIRKNIPRGYGFREQREEHPYRQKRAPEPKAHAVAAPAAPKPKAPQAAAFAVGDRVLHKAFGPGTLVKMTPMGGDYLIEIDFDQIGSKKLMLRAAALHMTKQ